jgi:uncharacterized protein (DUF983 family)
MTTGNGHLQQQTRAPFRKRLWAALRQRCPRCLRGRVFAGLTRMNEHCPICALKFGREPGYFLGAMYISYGLAIPVLALLAWLVQVVVLPTWPLHWTLLVGMLPFVLLVPAIFRYSRVFWMHLDRSINP